MGARGTIIEKFDRQSMTFAPKFKRVSDGAAMRGLLSTILLQMGGANSRQVVDMTGLRCLPGEYRAFSHGYDGHGSRARHSDAFKAAQRSRCRQQRPGSLRSGRRGTSVYQSVEQMGLKLEERKATVDRLVIDHVEKTPTEN